MVSLKYDNIQVVALKQWFSGNLKLNKSENLEASYTTGCSHTLGKMFTLSYLVVHLI